MSRKIVSVALLICTVAVLVLLALTWQRTRRLEASLSEMKRTMAGLHQDALSDPEPVCPLLLEFQLDLPGRGEVFPAMAAGPAPESWPVAVLSVTNTADRSVAQMVSAVIPGWSERMEQTIVVGPRETRRIQVKPALLPRAEQNTEIRAAVLEIRAVALDGAVLFAESRPVLIHGGSEIYWGRRFANAQMAARWVTPHDPAVLSLVSEARRFVPRGRMAGYVLPASSDEAVLAHQVERQAEAVFSALQKSGLSYVSSIFVMGDFVGEAQRIRLPAETLRLHTANCMDVSVVFASAMENLDMQPVLVMVPGHAFAGVRLREDSSKLLYLDLTVLPNGSFQSALSRARRWMRKTPEDEVLMVDIAAARSLGVYPLTVETPAAMR